MYLIGSTLILFFIVIVLLFSIGLPILSAVLVYKDAKKRTDCSPWLWALVAGLVPCFIGVVVYLIVRRDYPPKDGGYGYYYGYGGPGYRGAAGAGGAGAQGSAAGFDGYGVGEENGQSCQSGSEAEQAGARYEQYGAQYQTYTEEDGENGAQYSSAYSQAPQRKGGMPTWGKVLLIIAGVVVAICLIALLVSVVQTFFSYITADPFSGGYNYHYDF